MDFKDLITLYIKLQDSQLEPHVYQDLVDMLQEEYATQRDLISDLSGLVNIDITTYPKYLTALVSVEDFTNLSNWVIKNIVYLHKIKGTNQSWQKYFEWLLGKDDIAVVELQKQIVNETMDWDVTGPLKSNKILFTCETVSETLSYEDQLYYFEQIRDIAPVHTRIRPNVTAAGFDDTTEMPYGTLGCPLCETLCETNCELAIETWAGSSLAGTFNDTAPLIQDTVDVRRRCISTCELSCEDCCETSCECAPCELFCKLGCETQSTHGPHGGGGCQLMQETCGDCQLFCEFPCQDGCQFACQAECEFSCTIICQFACMLSCQDKITDCSLVCEIGNCEGAACELDCQASCELVPCQTGPCEIDPCQWGCTHGCTFSCDHGCEAAGCENIPCTIACQESCTHASEGPGGPG